MYLRVEHENQTYFIQKLQSYILLFVTLALRAAFLNNKTDELLFHRINNII